MGYIGQKDGFNDSSIGTSLLLQVQQRDPVAWQRIVHVYGPLIYRWCQSAGIADHLAADVGQEVFRAVANGIDRFKRENPGDTFVGWLRQITRHKIADCQRKLCSEPAARGGSTFLGVLGALEQPVKNVDDEGVNEGGLLDQERQLLVVRALSVLESNFQPKTWRAFWATAVENRPTKDVALDLELTTMAVRKAKSRVLRRLRDEFGDLIVEGQS